MLTSQLRPTQVFLALLHLVAGTMLVAASSGCASAPPLARGIGPLVSPPRATLLGPIRSIVVDAGHGGHDDGTSHFGLKEKTLALDITKRLRRRLEEVGLSIVLTRENDQFVELSRRPAVANRLGADLFVSVHINANRNRQVSGAEVYYPRISVVSAVSEWPPSVAPSEVGVPSVVVRQLLWDLVLRRTRAQSRKLATAICHAAREGGVPCRTIKPARFVVLREAWMPSVLVEVGYVTNRAEADRLADAAYRQAAAEAIADGIVAYIRELGAQHI